LHGNVISICRNGWESVASTTFRKDYFNELKNVTWGISNGYLYSKKLGYLHRYIMEKWYGKDLLDEMTANGWVVDHMDNDSMNCEISNLCFLSSDENKAKGFTVDKQSEALRSDIALNMFKDFSTDLFQISIFFNKETYFVNKEAGEYYSVASLRLLYDTDYTIVINDARTILLDYQHSGNFKLRNLHFVDYKIEKALLLPMKDEYKNKAVIEINGEQYLILNEYTKMHSLYYEKGWLPKSKTSTRKEE